MEEIWIECPHCGVKVPFEYSNCPECGHSLYPEEVEENQKPEISSPWLASLGAVILGWLAASLVAFCIHFLVSQFYTPKSIHILGQVLLFLSGPIAALVGGYVASALAKRQFLIYGLGIAPLAMINAVLLETHWQEMSLASVIQPGVWSNGVLILAAGMAGGWIYSKTRYGIQWPNWKRNQENKLYRDLLMKARYDHDRADRLIEYEHRRFPNSQRAELIKSAIERWERDNH